jgi:hypothetical protein
MQDNRYSSTRWRKLRADVLAACDHRCTIAGPRCTIIATTVDHITPVVLGGDFWSTDNLRGACQACNSGRGARLKNQRTRITIAQLQEMVLQQSYEIDRLRERLAAYEHPEPKRPPAPAIY